VSVQIEHIAKSVVAGIASHWWGSASPPRLAMLRLAALESGFPSNASEHTKLSTLFLHKVYKLEMVLLGT
jgi:hypothetical protein